MRLDKAYLQYLMDRISKQEDQKAFEILFKLFYGRLQAFAIHYVHRKELAEEAVSDVFVKLWHNRLLLGSVENIETYLFTATRNQSLNYIQQKNNHSFTTLKESNIYELIDNFSPQKEIELAELQANIQLAVEALPTQCRLVFKLIKEDGLKYKEVAEILNISVRTVETQLVRALQKLAVLLSPHIPSAQPVNKDTLIILVVLILLF